MADAGLLGIHDVGVQAARRRGHRGSVGSALCGSDGDGGRAAVIRVMQAAGVVGFEIERAAGGPVGGHRLGVLVVAIPRELAVARRVGSRQVDAAVGGVRAGAGAGGGGEVLVDEQVDELASGKLRLVAVQVGKGCRAGGALSGRGGLAVDGGRQDDGCQSGRAVAGGIVAGAGCDASHQRGGAHKTQRHKGDFTMSSSL